jgi:hypothetical protein
MIKHETFSLYIEKNDLNNFKTIKSETPEIRNRLIQVAAKFGRYDMITFLLDLPESNPTINNNLAIRIAVQHGYTDIVKLLLDNPNVNPADNDNSSIKIASKSGYTEIVKLLLKDPRVDPSDTNNYSLLSSLERGHLETVKLLLNDSRVNPIGNSSLYYIVFSPHYKYKNILTLLWSDQRIKQSLKKDDIVLYNALTQQDIKNKIREF